MKFAQKLQDNQTPEWKKAYIDYRGLKKRITVIRKCQPNHRFHIIHSDDSPDDDASPLSSDIEEVSRRDDGTPSSPNKGQDLKTTSRTTEPNRVSDEHDSISSKKPSLDHVATTHHLNSAGKVSNFTGIPGGRGLLGRRLSTYSAPPPLHEVLAHLTPQEKAFFTLLDAQLDKVECFYMAREKEMLARGHVLHQQLDELHEHRKLFQQAKSRVIWSSKILSNLKTIFDRRPPPVIERPPNGPKDGPSTDKAMSRRSTSRTLDTDDGKVRSTSSALPEKPTAKSMGKRKDLENDHSLEAADESTTESEERPRLPLSADPDSYFYARRKLKKAVIEHYHGLELLHNYRVLNLDGFRKALKKFEKITHKPVQDRYMAERVEKSSFASDEAVKKMMDEMEVLYAAAFARGDQKRAKTRLRVGSATKSHHFSAFKSGLYVGLAVPALAYGLFNALQRHTHQAMPAWGPLLFVYGVFLIPVVFSFLLGINLMVWSTAQINYSFIFELDMRTQIDFRQYFEIPSILFSSLCYAFWLSFSLTDHPRVSPTIWPLIWLAFTAIVLFNPLPILHRPSRYWLIKIIARQFVSGTRPVEFADFWMGDQFCSLIFTLSNLYFFVCVYADDFSANWAKCGAPSPAWPVGFSLAALPLLIRMVQSIKRYADSKLVTHLINGGKYGSGIITYLFYFMWRHHENERGTIFALWCLASTCYALYGGAWDLLMDWSLLRTRVKNPLLRSDLIYSDQIPLYYFAIVSDILIRFIWVIYIPRNGPNLMVRTFIGGFLEMLRRWQWNFYRLENEHLGNMDQYRATREVPLPYALNDRNVDDDDDDDHQLKVKR